MSTERIGSPESDGIPELLQDLLDQSTYIVSEAFDYMLNNTRRGYAEYVQIDSETMPGLKLYSVLLSPSGGKPDEGTELLRVLAYPASAEAATDLDAAVALMHSGDDLPFRTDRFLIESTSGKRDERPLFFQLDEEGITQLHYGEDLDERVKEQKIDIDGLLKKIVEITPTEPKAETDGPITEEVPIEMLLFALDLQEKLSDNKHWFVIPQN